MRLLYSLSIYALLTLLLTYFLWRSLREPEYRRRWGERLGFVSSHEPGAIWIHAASVGEVQAVTPLINAVLARQPDARLLVTTFTPTGSALVQRRIAENWRGRVKHCYLPLDTPGAVSRFLDRTEPTQLLIAETELWPNLLLACGRRGIAVDLVSATLSDKSLQRYSSFPLGQLLPEAITVVRRVLAQTGQDADRFQRLGVHPERIEVIGNLKFDYSPPAGLDDQARALRAAWGALERPLWVAASTHEGEEQIVLDAFRQLRADIHDLLLVLVPRHPQRFERSYRLCREARVSVARHSRHDRIDEETEVVLGDTLGELLKFYAAADVVFIGGSLVPVGGHNLLEPASLGHAVVCGPHTGSQAQLRSLLEAADAFVEVKDARSLVRATKRLLDAPSHRERAGEAARAVVRDNQGVVQKTVEILFGSESAGPAG